MHKFTILFALVASACALDSNTSSIESQSTCEKDCEPPPKGPTCTVRGREVDLDSLPANVDHSDDKVTICHATGSESNPYILITPNVDGCHGHANENHEPGGNEDIFPSQGCAD